MSKLKRAIFAVFVAFSLVSCSSNENKYIGYWKCAEGGERFIEIKDNGGSLLLTDNEGTYSATINQDGVLVVQASGFTGTVHHPIDSSTGELLCNQCGCKRFVKQ